MSTVPKLYKLSLGNLLKTFFSATDYKTITMIYQDLPDLKKYMLPIEEWDSLYHEIFIGYDNDDKLIEFIGNKLTDNQFSKKEILKRAEEKFYNASYKYASSLKK
jgi:hypothetical protein